MENAATEVAGLLAKFAGNAGSREFNGFSLTRDWDTGKGEWIYTVRKK
jgi:hypothetical protein